MEAKRGRKSAADLGVVALSGARLPVPAYLSEAQAAEWKGIVDSLPASYFRPGDAPILGVYCVASALYKQALEALNREGMILEEVKSRTVKTDGTVVEVGGRKYAHPAKDILSSQAASMAQMAVKLRLCPSARTEKAAGAKAGAGGARRPPWMAGGE